MRILQFFVVMMTFLSCQMSTKTNTKELPITYFKDGRTGLCFAAVNSISNSGYEVTSIACVPCDSLKKYRIPTIHNKEKGN